MVEDKCFEVSISNEKIRNRVEELGAQISKDYQDKKPLIVVVLKGAFVFAADLVRRLECTFDMAFVSLSSYVGMQSTGKINVNSEIGVCIESRDVIIVEDIVDSGRTLFFYSQELDKKSPNSVKLCSLLVKPNALEFDFPIHYVGFEIPNDFVVGYGLDYNEEGRGLSSIYKFKG